MAPPAEMNHVGRIIEPDQLEPGEFRVALKSFGICKKPDGALVYFPVGVSR
jgi:hypothetical protein